MTPARLFVTGFGVGFMRPAPGTWGSAAALLTAVPVLWLGGPWLLSAAVLIVVVLALAAIPRGAPPSGVADPPEVVIDEIAGQWIALLPVAFGAWRNGADYLALWPGWVTAFLLFRLLDIWKPGPVGWADRQSGALGVLLDDVVAGALAALGVVILAGFAHAVVLR